MNEYVGTDGTHYYAKPPSGGVSNSGKSKVLGWYDKDGALWQPIRIGTGKGRMMWYKA